MRSGFILAGATFAFLGVAAGAFGAHALRGHISADRMAVYQTAVQYQLVHALALLTVGALASGTPAKPLNATGWLFSVGIVIFSGSLYALALTGMRWSGAITPVGGVCFLAGWLIFAFWANRRV